VSEQLIIRLASEANQEIHWLIWSDREQKVVSFGKLTNALALNELTKQAYQRKVICLIPNIDVTLKSLKMEGKFTRKMQQALPYMLEDELASDVDNLHFSVFAKGAGAIQVAICAKSKLAMWLAWLSNADIMATMFIPEVFSLPTPMNDKWLAVKFNNHWIIRENVNYGWSCESEMLNNILQLRLEEGDEQLIESYSELPEGCAGEWQQNENTSVLNLFFLEKKTNNFNMLDGEFEIKKESSLLMKKWKAPAYALLLCCLIYFANQIVQIKQLEKRVDLVKRQTEEVYQQAFPNESPLKYNRIKKRLKSLLGKASDIHTESSFLTILNDLLPAFEVTPSLEVSTLKFNSKKNEVTLAISVDSFLSFELLSKNIPEKYQVEQSTLSNHKNRVSGTLTVRAK